MFNTEKYIEVDVISSETNTLGKFLFSEEPVVSKGTTAFDIVGVEDNLDRILSKFPTQDKKTELRGFNNPTQASQISLKPGTKLLIPRDKLNVSFLVSQSTTLSRESSVLSFVASQLERLQKDKGYVVEHVDNSGINSVKELLPFQTVWLWSRSLSQMEGGELQGKIIDLSPFLEHLEFGVDGNGGNFNLKLPPVTVGSNPDGTWSPLSALTAFFSFSKNQKEVQATSHTHKINQKGEWERSQYLFNNIISKGDVIFIRTEKLSLEGNREVSPSLFIPPSSLPGQIYDMIGVVDDCRLDSQHESQDYNISIQGRDLMKLLIDDGSYFFPLEFARGTFQQAGSQYSAYSLVQRSFVSGKFLSLFAFTERSIPFTLQFILNQLSFIKIVPDTLFQAYGDQRSFRFTLDDTPQETNKELTRGIWQIVKLVFDGKDPFISKRRVVDSSISEEQGSLLNSIRKVCQPEFVEFFGDTYGDQYYFVLRTPPFTRELFISLLQGDTVGEIETVDFGSGPRDVISIGARRTVKSVVEIDDSDVVFDGLGWETEGSYSWYRLDPKASFMGTGSQISLGFLPAIFFPELGEIYGNTPLQVVSNYVDYNAYQDATNTISVENLEKSVISDLKFLIDSNSYRPFTRRGTLTIRPDRRIKRGTLIELKSTGEVFYVDGVRNSRTYSESGVDGNTVLQVSRGMVKDFIFGREVNINGETINISYFDIIKTPLPQNNFVATANNSNPYESILGAWKVDKRVLDFFLTRSQFKDVYRK